ncbi:MAG: hypothetical protein JO250_20075 [Armatimonadetes bacterium]|nr:hypothetical protein [Armatimonadota bacterium]
MLALRWVRGSDGHLQMEWSVLEPCQEPEIETVAEPALSPSPLGPIVRRRVAKPYRVLRVARAKPRRLISAGLRRPVPSASLG